MWIPCTDKIQYGKAFYFEHIIISIFFSYFSVFIVFSSSVFGATYMWLTLSRAEYVVSYGCYGEPGSITFSHM